MPSAPAEILHPHITAVWENEVRSCLRPPQLSNRPRPCPISGVCAKIIIIIIIIIQSCTKGLIGKLPKKRDLCDCANWRGIILLNTRYEKVATIIPKWLQCVEQSLREQSITEAVLIKLTLFASWQSTQLSGAHRSICCSSILRRHSTQYSVMQYGWR